MFNSFSKSTIAAAAFGALATIAIAAPARAAPLPLFPFFLPPQQVEAAPPPVAAAPSQDEGRVEMPARLRRQVVNYSTREAPGTIHAITANWMYAGRIDLTYSDAIRSRWTGTVTQDEAGWHLRTGKITIAP